MRRTVKDLAGHQVGVGDRIVAAFRTSTNAYMRVGRVVGFGERNEGYNTKRETLVVEWGDDNRRTQIFVHLRRFAKIEE